MRSSGVEIALTVNTSRYLPLQVYRDSVKQIADSGLIDQLALYDQLNAVFPSALWKPENTRLAELLPDLDSYPDNYAMLAYAAAVAPALGTSISTDGARRGPAELMQTMMTIANMTQGKSIFQIGAGEIKQFAPYGWKRNQGLKRLEDTLKAIKLFWENDGWVDMAGHYFNLDGAWLGDAKLHKPRVWGLGGGPKLIDITTSYADGFATMSPLAGPLVWPPEKWAATVTSIKQDLERKGRDPEKFEFGIWGSILTHDDEAWFERAMHNSFLKYWAASCGRLHPPDWLAEGHQPLYPDDWHYATKAIFYKMTAAEVDEKVRGVDADMCAKSFNLGTPEQLAALFQEYVDAGATWICLLDFSGFVLPPEEQQDSLQRLLRIAKILKKSA